MNQPLTIDINCDLGEGNTLADCQQDALLMPFISSCNIACGGHAGNQLTIEQSILNAIKNDVKIGAHPGYFDQRNFGRRTLLLSEKQLHQSLAKQLHLFSQIADQLGAPVNHLKLHGALYNDVEAQPALARQVCNFIVNHYPMLKVYGLAGGELEQCCHQASIEFIPEGFIDRSYLSDGKLTPRSQSGALIQTKQACIEQAIKLACNQPIATADGQTIMPRVKTLCLHGDNPQALAIAQQLRASLKNLDIEIR